MNTNTALNALTEISSAATCRVWKIEDGCIALPRKGARTKEWMATWRCSRAARGGVDRQFWDRGERGFAAVPSDLEPGDTVACEGYDTNSRGRKTNGFELLYQVLRVTGSEIWVRRIEDARKAGPLPLWLADAQPANPLDAYSTEDLVAALQARGWVCSRA